MEESPCIGLCQCNEEDICIGCGRTREEVSTWVYMDDDERRKVKEKSKNRLIQIRK